MELHRPHNKLSVFFLSFIGGACNATNVNETKYMMNYGQRSKEETHKIFEKSLHV